MKKITQAVAGFDPVPSIKQSAKLKVSVSKAVPADAGAVGIPVGTNGPVPRGVGLDRAALTLAEFDGKVGQALMIPKADGGLVVAIGRGHAEATDEFSSHRFRSRSALA